MAKKSYVFDVTRATATENKKPLTEEELMTEIDRRKIELANVFMVGYLTGVDDKKIMEVCKKVADEYLEFMAEQKK